MTVKLSSALPESHGLTAIRQRLVDEPTVEHIVLARIDTKTLTTDLDTGDVSPTVRLIAVEPIRDTADANDAIAMLQRAEERRTGKTPLQFDLQTGEVR